MALSECPVLHNWGELKSKDPLKLRLNGAHPKGSCDKGLPTPSPPLFEKIETAGFARDAIMNAVSELLSSFTNRDGAKIKLQDQLRKDRTLY